MRLTRRRAAIGGLGVAMAAVTAVGGVAVAASLSTTTAARPLPLLAFPITAPTASPDAPAAAPAPTPTVTAHNAPAVAPLGGRITPDVLVVAPQSLTPAQIADIEATAGPGTKALVVDEGTVHLGGGTTMALGVDPSTFRAWTPAGTAESDELWQAVARGDVAVAHAVGKALAVPLGDPTAIGATAPTPERVGAYATTGIPGVGVVADAVDDPALQLTPSAAVLLTSPGRDPVVTAAVLAQHLGATATATPVRVPVTNGHLQWVAPAYGPITSPFGARSDPNRAGQIEVHEGIDIGAPLGAPIYAAAAGVVQYAGPASGFGNEVVLTHADGVTTVYGHMEQILVTHGPVAAGQPIALVGAEGDATGPHLHFEVHLNDTPVDPAGWLQAHGVRIVR